MVKIVEQGYNRLTCWKCKSLLEYQWSEVKTGKFNTDYLGDYDLEDYITCPSCNTKCIIRKSL